MELTLVYSLQFKNWFPFRIFFFLLANAEEAITHKNLSENLIKCFIFNSCGSKFHFSTMCWSEGKKGLFFININLNMSWLSSPWPKSSDYYNRIKCITNSLALSTQINAYYNDINHMAS